MLRIFLVLCVTVVGFAIWLLPQQDRPAVDVIDDHYQFIEKNCWFHIPWQQDIVCGELHTPSTSGGFTLPVVRIRDHSANHQPDPLLYLPGGPGGSARLDEEGIAHWINWLNYAGLGRDLILMEPRGVGLSRPRLTCKAYDQFSLAVLKQNLSLVQELAEGYRVVSQCVEQMQHQGFVATHYTTPQNAADVRALMQLLAARNPAEQEWNLLGVSYGSRLAMVTAENFPMVRALILDSVYPPGYGGTQEWPELFDQSMRRYLAWCEASTTCRAPAPEKIPLTARLMQALDALRASPVTLNIRRWNGEAPVDVVLNDHRFLSAVFAALYSVYDWEKIPPAIEAAITGKRAPLIELVEPFINHAFADDFSAWVFMAVDCHDHPPLAEDDYAQQVDKHPLFAEYTRDLWRYQPCHLLSAKGTTQLELASSPQQPALLLAGKLDPITPVEWAQLLHARWHNSQLIVRDDIGHAVINSDACVHGNLRQFLDNPDQPLLLACEND